MTQPSLFPTPPNARAEELERQVRHHNRLYWDQAAPEISDTDYDLLVRELTALWPQAPVLHELGPSSRAPPAAPGADEVARLGTEVVHREPMLSLDKAYTDDELQQWMAKIQGDLLMMPKVDGVACAIHYNAAGRLHLAATRGDGERGDDVTANVRRAGLVPAQVTLHNVEVRGEIHMKRSVFKARWAAQFANPRNLTAGAIKQKDPARCAEYGLSFFAYDLRGGGQATESEKMAVLAQAGFDVMQHEVVAPAAAAAAYVRMAALRDAWDFEADGVVFRADRVSEQDRLGETNHHPRWALAYKFAGETARARLLDVTWGVSRTGTLTPVANIEPTPLSGVTVSRASLHHAGYLKKLGLARGATLLVMRRGDVIPHVEGVVEAGGEPFALPTQCPSCGGPVALDGDFLACARPEACPDALVGTVKHFTATVDIQGLGPKVLKALFDAALIRTPADLYALKAEQLAALDRMGDTLAHKLVGNIEARRRLPLAVFLAALGIDELGPTVAETLTHHFPSLDALRGADEAALASVHGVGPSIAHSVVHGLQARAVLIDALLTHVTLEAPSRAVVTGHALSGRSVVFTGTLARLDRKEAQKRVVALGGRTPSGVTKELDYLVVGVEKDGGESTKLKSARKLAAAGAPVRILTEDEFLALLA
ncbi:MAG: NAD-dependent DNA ligase LigA [Deltaproteobacteria bacterium]|nr:NAD-dependent DNA ligase LigA [Deltaproteobacteria bacterium]